MSRMIPQEYIQCLLAKTDIVKLIGDEIHLDKRKQRAEYIGICPFHDPGKQNMAVKNFTVSGLKNFYHCFHCGAHGTIIQFYMDFKSLKFPEAVTKLAEKVGFSMPPIEPFISEKNRESESIAEALRAIVDYYRVELKKSQAAIDFLKRAGITGSTAKLFQIGYAPDSWESLKPLMGDQYETLGLDAGVVVKSKTNGRVYDRFRDRVIFPTLGANNRILGITGLQLHDIEPIYLRNARGEGSDHSGIFGMNQANAAMRVARSVVLVQDCLDVLRLREGGVHNVICAAEMGRLKTIHVESIIRRAPCIVCFFPGTKQGDSDAWSAMKSAIPALDDSVEIRFVTLPDGQSPGDILMQEDGHSLFQSLLKYSTPLCEFLLQGLVRRHDIRTIGGRAKLMAEADKILGKMIAENTKALIHDAIHGLVFDRLELLDSVEEHDAWLSRVIESTRSELVIVSPWITPSGVTRFDLCEKIASAVRRGVNVIVYADAEHARGGKASAGLGRLDDRAEIALVAAGAKLIFVHRIHSKVVISDVESMCIGSFNWLSAVKSGKYKRHEVSIVYGQADVGVKKNALLAELNLRLDAPE